MLLDDETEYFKPTDIEKKLNQYQLNNNFLKVN